MEQRWRDPQVDNGLTVLLGGVVRRQLRADPDETLTFGRSKETPDHLHVGPPDGRDDCNISRVAGSVSWSGDHWTLRNTSSTRPFVVVNGHGVRVPLAPRTGGRSTQWAIGTDGALVELPSPTGTYEIAFRPVVPRGATASFSGHSGPSTFTALDRAYGHELVVLAAKFLSRRQPGAAVGDACAAERATRARGRRVTAKAVENIVAGRRTQLVDAGFRDVTGRSNVDRVGVYLLALGVLRVEDRLGIDPLHVEDDPRA